MASSTATAEAPKAKAKPKAKPLSGVTMYGHSTCKGRRPASCAHTTTGSGPSAPWTAGSAN